MGALEGLPPDFLSSLLALAIFLRLSIMKAAHVGVGGAPWQEIRVARLFGPTYAEANVGHPSRSMGCARRWGPSPAQFCDQHPTCASQPHAPRFRVR